MQVIPVVIKIDSSGLKVFSTYLHRAESRKTADRQTDSSKPVQSYLTFQRDTNHDDAKDGGVPNREDDLSQRDRLLHRLMAHRLQPEVMQVCIQAGISDSHHSSKMDKILRSDDNKQNTAPLVVDLFNTRLCAENRVSRTSSLSTVKFTSNCTSLSTAATTSTKFVLENIKPKVLWGENDPGLFLSLGEAMVPTLRSLGMQYGYSFSMVTTKLHGLPLMRTFFFFWKSPVVPFLNYIRREAPPLIENLRDIQASVTFQNNFVAEGNISGAITISKYLDKYNLVVDCINWLKTYFPNDPWSVIPKGGKSRTHTQYLEHQKEKLGSGMGYCDDSTKFMGDHFTTSSLNCGICCPS